ncbi:pentatricopeptide repeat-containing protein [Pyrus ussuriensis x Pyrus communis]|uniref:Pentatricopeptide repeat-containing protein n=1 Tax=Pyrus ussuriensis x Pyrus communis TaxID=2448454 RepID=A0A5N5HSK3_9ROSA|nr:pentatricopeptide repeat-containing protein [Pyrus ussuriensis x Pyrus communis]
MMLSKSFNIQISATTNGYVQRALQSLHGIDGPDCGAYGHFIQHCTVHRLVRQAKQLHARLVLFSVTPGNFLASKLINFYSKTNNINYARKVFDQIPHPNAFSWNAMLIGYSINNMHADTLKWFSAMVSSCSDQAKPDNFTVTCVLKALGVLLSGSKLAKEVHCFVLRSGFDSDVFVVNSLITYYSRCDEVGLARALFDRIPERDIVSWNSMIAGYSQAGYYDECKELYRMMLGLEKFKPVGLTVVSTLQACLQSNDLMLGMEVHQFVIENQIEMDVLLCNALIGLYARCGSLDYAQELFDEMSEKDEVTYGSLVSGYMFHGFVDKAMDVFRDSMKPKLSTWNAVISGLVQNNQHEEALNLIREMQACGCKPNTVTLSSILPTISYFSNLKVGKEVHAYAVRNNFDWNIYVETAIIDTYAKSGFLYGAQRVFDQAKGKSLIIWTSIISAYASHGDADTSLGLFYEMLNSGIQPDQVTFTAVLTACAHSGVVDEAWKIFDAMFPEYGIQPSVEHYACMVGILSRAGKLTEAADFIHKMPVEPSAKVWGALLNGASVSRDVELGKFACDRLFQIEPENTGNYIIMANLYSQAGRWEEADKVRERMKEVGLRKIPGSSWIETSKGLQSFIVKDTSNERTEEIYETLEGLLGMMKEKGYALQDELDEESVNV